MSIDFRNKDEEITKNDILSGITTQKPLVFKYFPDITYYQI